MLLGLAIRDVVLIDRLDLAFAPGLSRADRRDRRRQVDPARRAGPGARRARRRRPGAARAPSRPASPPSSRWRPTIRPAPSSPSTASTVDGNLLLRRPIGADGRSRAFVNDQPAASACCASSATGLVEIHGQFEQHGLLDPATHRELLDAFGGPTAAGAGRRLAAPGRRPARHATPPRRRSPRARRDEDFLRHAAEPSSTRSSPSRRGERPRRAARLLLNREQARRGARRRPPDDLAGERRRRGAAEPGAPPARAHRRQGRGRLDAAAGRRSTRAPPKRPRRWPRSSRLARELDADPRRLEKRRGAALRAARSRPQAQRRRSTSCRRCASAFDEPLGRARRPARRIGQPDPGEAGRARLYVARGRALLSARARRAPGSTRR